MPLHSYTRSFYLGRTLLKSMFRLFFLFMCLGQAMSENIYPMYFLEKSCETGSLNVSMTKSGSSSAGILKATSSLKMLCKIELVAPPQHWVVVSLREVNLRKDRHGTCEDHLEVDEEVICETIYSENEERHYWSSTNVMKLFYYTFPDGLPGNPGITLTFTALSKATGKNCTGVEQFHCGNGYCIWSGLTCDGHNNCGDLSDEDAQGNSKCGRKRSSVLIVLAVLLVLLFLLMCVVTLLCRRNEAVRRFSTRLRSRTISFIPRIR